VSVARGSAADRIASFVLVTLILPGLAATAWELWFVIAHSTWHGHGQLLVVYAMYGAGVIAWSGLRVLLQRGLAVVLAVTVFFVGMPLGAALASLGPLSLLLLLLGIGGVVASLGFPNARTSDM
jgi:hypothetical protein